MDTGAETDDGSSGTTTDPTDPSGTTAGGETTSATSTTTPTATSGVSSTGSETTDDSADTTGAVVPLPDGSSCTSDEGCESGMCSMVSALLPDGVCGECNGDDSCEFGCTPGVPMLEPIFPAPLSPACHDGSNGSACETVEACAEAGALCVPIINQAGILTISACSSCETTADCTDQVCNLSISVPTVSGEWSCVDVGSIVDGETCDLDGDGTEACENICGPVSVGGLLDVGVCGECAGDGDCADGMTCEQGVFADDGSATPAACI